VENPEDRAVRPPWPAILIWLVIQAGGWRLEAEGQTPQTEAQTLARQGDAAATANRHQEAIELYGRAIELDASIREAVLPSLALRYLWSNRPARAAALLAERLDKHPDDCDARFYHALALSWASQQPAALAAYRNAANLCPARAQEARLGQARVARWMERPSLAEELYRGVEREGSEPQKQEARVGQGLTEMARDNNRAARRMFSELTSAGSRDPSAFEAEAIAELRLGGPNAALHTLERAAEAGARGDGLDALQAHIGGLRRPTLTPSTNSYWDGDGTSFRSTELSVAASPDLRTTVAGFSGWSRLEQLGRSADAQWGGVSVGRGFSEAWALRAEARLTGFRNTGFRPFTGQVNAMWTPSDRLRVDLGAGRLALADYIPSFDHRLTGASAGAGITFRITPLDSASAALDVIHWSEGNRRIRARLDFARRFEGRPQITIDLPINYQSYDHAFSFGLYSPLWNIEAGPGLRVHLRRTRQFWLSLYARAGAGRDAVSDWSCFGTYSFDMERELARTWGFHFSTGWTNSNLASSTGFRRRSLTFSLNRRL
jgi:tetratricopeptide (TPR) repeat protein